MADFDPEALLAPLRDDAPCGADLEYDPAFLALQAAATGRPERQYGDTVIPAEEPDWPTVHELALALARRTRDLRVAAWLVRSGARLNGWPGALNGLQLVQGLLDRHWAHVHPQLDASDANDPTARLNALQPLLHPSAAIEDLRTASIIADSREPRVRDVELAFGRAEPLPGEMIPTEQGLLEALSRANADASALRERLQAGVLTVQGMASAIEQHLGTDQSLDFAPLLSLMRPLASLAARLHGVAASSATLDATAATAAGPALSGDIHSREDALRALQRACEWIERNEPGHPAPLLIRRAQRLMSKSFLDIIRDLLPEGVPEVERIAGASTD